MEKQRTPPEQVVPDDTVDRARLGDPEAIASIYIVMQARLLRYARRKLGRRDLAEAVVQETFARAMADLSQRPPGLHVKSWLYRIAANLIHDEYRNRREVSLEERHDWANQVNDDDVERPAVEVADLGQPLMMGDMGADPADLYERQEEQQILAAQLSRVLERMEEWPNGPLLVAVLTHQAEGATYEQIAALLGVDVGRVKVLAERARLVARRLWS